MVALLAGVAVTTATEILISITFVLWVSAVVVTDAVVTLLLGLDEDGER